MESGLLSLEADWGEEAQQHLPKAMTMRTGPRSGEGWRISTKFRGKGPHAHARASTPGQRPRNAAPPPSAAGPSGRRVGRSATPGRQTRRGSCRGHRQGSRTQGRGGSATGNSSSSGAQDPARTAKGAAEGREDGGRDKATRASSGATGSSDRGRQRDPDPDPRSAGGAARPLQVPPTLPAALRGRAGLGAQGERAGSGGVPRPQAGRPPRSASGSRAPRLPAAGPRSRAAPAAAVLQALTSLRGLRFLPSFAHRSARGPAPPAPPPAPPAPARPLPARVRLRARARPALLPPGRRAGEGCGGRGQGGGVLESTGGLVSSRSPPALPPTFRWGRGAARDSC